MLTSRSFPRHGGAVDVLVLLLAFLTFCCWAVGYVFLIFFPSPAPATEMAKETGDGIKKTVVDSESKHVVHDLKGGTANGGDGAANGSGTNDSLANSSDGSDDGFGDPAGANSFEPNPQNNQFAPMSPSGGDSAAKINAESQRRLEALQDEVKNLRKQILDSDGEAANQQKLVADQQRLLGEKDNQLNMLSQKFDAANQEAQQLKTKLAEMAAAPAPANMEEPSDVIPSLNEFGSTKSETIAAPVFRKWTGNNGRIVEMAFIRWDGDDLVFVGKNNSVYVMPPSRLSDADIQLVETYKEK